MSKRSLPAPPTRVTAYEDRAEVLREVPIEAFTGRLTLTLTALTPLLSDAHLSARISGPAEVEDVSVRRRWVQPDEAAAAATLQARIDEALAKLERLQRALARAEQRLASARRNREAYAKRLGAAIWRGEAEGWREGLARLEAAVEAALAAAEPARTAAEQAQREARDLSVLTAAEPEPRLVADVTVRLRGGVGEAATLSLTHLVACALWRPAHEARLVGDTLHWQTFGTVWQRTGEDWSGVELRLSTARPGAGAELPDLEEDHLRLQGKVHKKRVVLAHRDEAVSRDQGAAAVPGVYDGGEAREFSATVKVDLPSDGRGHRVATGGFEAPVETTLVCIPELARHVFLRARLSNTGATPILAGPVTLVREGAYVGEGEVAYVGPGEGFDLGFGSDDRFGVTYERKVEVEKRVLGADRRHFIASAALQSTATERSLVWVEMRLPRSELEALQVKVSGQHCTQGDPEPDAQGLVRVPLELYPADRELVTLGFWLDKSGDVVLPDPW